MRQAAAARVCTTRAELRGLLDGAARPVGAVLTMGALHEGHLALVRAVRERVGPDGLVLVTVFVNPLQFAPGEDLDRYPRNLAGDVERAAVAGADAVWAPPEGEVYPGGRPQVTVAPGPLASELEGAARPTHFAGVLTVVAKLFGLLRPDVTAFGEKDYQQLALVRRMVADLELRVDVLAVPTVREPDGLALSSRNAYLDPTQRQHALALSRALRAGAAAGAGGPDSVVAAAEEVLAGAVRDSSGGMSVDYLVLRAPDLAPPSGSGAARLLGAVRLGATRLLDNVRVDLGGTLMLLAVDVGNTQTVLGLIHGPTDAIEVVEHWRVATDERRTADELAVLVQGLLGIDAVEEDVDGVVVCSTVPAMLHEMRDMLERHYAGVPSVVVEPGVRSGIPLLVDNPREVGTDRIVNALAAVHLHGGPCVIVDFGTATTFDAVSAKGEYLGGAIAPGIGISLDALGEKGAQLRKVELLRPRSVIARNTVEALQSGALYGFAGQVDGIVTRMAAELRVPLADLPVIATGGLAPLVLSEARTVDSYEPWLTLLGLRLVFDRNRR